MTAAAATPLIQVDRYVLCDPIAVGGMATVYFARQRGAAGFAKAVAIKRMRPDLVHQREFVDLFVDEARLASRVRHANVVSVIDVVASGDELLLVMEYFHGESLHRLLTTASKTKKRVPPPIAIAIICNILHGLHAAHEAKGDDGEPLHIVHRDVSPQNVLVGVDGIARVADFGIARAVGQIHATDEGKTRGKAGYSAPEQLRGAAVTRKIDLFAACALLWEILVGRRLFDGETQAAVITAVLTESIDAPGLHVPELPEELDEIVMRGLDRDPKKRPETALELAALLERVVPPANAASVTAWVMDLAREELDKREAIVRRIEAGRFESLPPPATSSPPTAADDSNPRTSTLPLAPISSTPLLLTVDPGTGSLATSRSPSAAPPSLALRARSRVVPIVLGAIGIVAVIGVGAASIAYRSSGTATATTPTTSSPPFVSAPTASEVAPSASTGVVDDPVVPASASASSSTARRPVVLTPKASSAPARPKSKRCDPPYDLDPAGRKIFRVECL